MSADTKYNSFSTINLFKQPNYDRISQELTFTHTTARHTFHHHMTAVSLTEHFRQVLASAERYPGWLGSF